MARKLRFVCTKCGANHTIIEIIDTVVDEDGMGVLLLIRCAECGHHWYGKQAAVNRRTAREALFKTG